MFLNERLLLNMHPKSVTAYSGTFPELYIKVIIVKQRGVK